MIDESAGDFAEAMNVLMSDLEQKLSTLGLYMINAEVGIVANNLEDGQKPEEVNIVELMEHPKGYNIYISSIFKMSDDICWSDRVLNPEKHEADKEFRVIAPTELEVTLESMKDELLNWESEE